jgi:hypothetical protein
MRDFFFVSCSRGGKEDTPLYRSIQKLGISDYYFFENNRRGLPDCYNEYLNKLAGTDLVVVLAHADVTVADVFVREKLTHAAKTFSVVGLAGSAYFDLQLQTPSYEWEIWPQQYLSGAVEQVLRNGLTSWFSLGPTPRRCVVLDGLFLAIDMRAIGNVRFDSRFSFHLYDIDFCLSAHLQSLVLGTTNVYVQHASCGNFDSLEYRQAVEVFRTKWRGSTAAGNSP